MSNINHTILLQVLLDINDHLKDITVSLQAIRGALGDLDKQENVVEFDGDGEDE